MQIPRQELVKALQLGVLTGLQIGQNQLRQAFYLAKRDSAARDEALRGWAELAREHSRQVVARAKLTSIRTERANQQAEAVRAKSNGNGFHWGWGETGPVVLLYGCSDCNWIYSPKTPEETSKTFLLMAQFKFEQHASSTYDADHSA